MSLNWHLGCRYPSPLPVPVSAASTPKYTILQRRHTQIEAEEKDKKETVANEKVGPIKRLTKVLKDALSHIPQELMPLSPLRAHSLSQGPNTTASTPKYTILQWRHTWIEAEEKDKKETVANKKVGPIKHLTKVLKDVLSGIP